MTNLTRVVHTMQCNHAEGGSACVNQGAGHTMQSIQRAVVAATPSKWADAIVRHATSDGWIAIDLLDGVINDGTVTDDALNGGGTVWLWNHEDLTATVTPGQPVALHTLYNALAVGSARVSVFKL
ncbi:hypothetical protein [Salinibacterium sp. ZJ454]|uniref:hypothetical protein n=1 Tax=Salinibacterium sp. ZJ454 TaxID=2708339 RepID=UPI001421828F|nr:hypothetical protein [Salinibacterium sp. ZJ454]